MQSTSPLELVQQLFVKLGMSSVVTARSILTGSQADELRLTLFSGVRQVVVVNEKGFYQGLISKSQWLSFLAKLEEENGH